MLIWLTRSRLAGAHTTLGGPPHAAMADAEEEPVIDDYPAWVQAVDERGRPLPVEAQDRPWRPGVDPQAEGLLEPPAASPLVAIARAAAQALAREAADVSGEAVPPESSEREAVPMFRPAPHGSDRGPNVRCPPARCLRFRCRLCRLRTLETSMLLSGVRPLLSASSRCQPWPRKPPHLAGASSLFCRFRQRRVNLDTCSPGRFHAARRLLPWLLWRLCPWRPAPAGVAPTRCLMLRMTKPSCLRQRMLWNAGRDCRWQLLIRTLRSTLSCARRQQRSRRGRRSGCCVCSRHATPLPQCLPSWAPRRAWLRAACSHASGTRVSLLRR